MTMCRRSSANKRPLLDLVACQLAVLHLLPSFCERAMKLRRLGKTGLKVSEICLGTMTFGHQCDEATSIAIMDRAAAGGVTFIDTADVYPVPPTIETAGRSEEIVGRWLKSRRDRFVL